MALEHIKGKIAEFVEKRGMSAHAFWVSVLIFPPAALYIALKKPEWNVLQRVLHLICLVIFLAIIPIVGAASVKFVLSLFGS